MSVTVVSTTVKKVVVQRVTVRIPYPENMNDFEIDIRLKDELNRLQIPSEIDQTDQFKIEFEDISTGWLVEPVGDCRYIGTTYRVKFIQ